MHIFLKVSHELRGRATSSQGSEGRADSMKHTHCTPALGSQKTKARNNEMLTTHDAPTFWNGTPCPGWTLVTVKGAGCYLQYELLPGRCQWLTIANVANAHSVCGLVGTLQLQGDIAPLFLKCAGEPLETSFLLFNRC